MKANAVPVLAVDDNQEDLALISTALSRNGHRVIAAQTGRQALAEIERHAAPVVLVDLALPDMSGLDVLRAAQKKDHKATGIVLTASNTAEAAIESMRHGAFDFLVKPCGFDLLNVSVDRAAQHYLLQRALDEKTEQVKKLRERYSDSVSAATQEAGSLNEHLETFIAHLKEVNACRSRFLADVSHELKSPLTVINGYATFLLERFPRAHLPEELRKGLVAIQDNSVQLQSLVEDLLDVARLETHKVQLNLEPIQAADLVRQIADDFRFQAEARGIQLTHGCAASATLRAKGDLKRLRQVLGNLVSNALKFTKEKGCINVWAWPEGDWVRFSVQDTGMGIPAEQCAHIFERYYQADNSGDYSKGLGLGLEISKGLVELHGGRIWVESTVGKGTRFDFVVPSTAERPDPSRYSVPPVTAIRYSKR